MVGLKQLIGSWGSWTTPAVGAWRRRTESAEETEASSRDRLVRTIEGEIIPRLMMVHRAEAGFYGDTGGQGRPLDGEDVAEFARLVLEHDAPVASSYLAALRAQGVTLEAIFLDLMAPAARLLGELWVADLRDFSEVTIGLSRMQQLLRELSPAFENEGEMRGQGRRILLAAAPGEQHTFGIFMVEEFFRRAGWDVWSHPTTSRQGIIQAVRKEWFSVVGLSFSCDILLDQHSSFIRSVRRYSRNPTVGVMVGGRSFVDDPDLVSRIGADVTAADARQAVMQAQSLLDMLARRC